MNDNTKRILNNFTIVKALDDVDQAKAIELMSNPDLDGKELSEILECGLTGKFVDKTTQEPLKLSKEVMMAGIRNRFSQIAEQATNETE